MVRREKEREVRSLREESRKALTGRCCGWHWPPLGRERIWEVRLLLATAWAYLARNG